MALLVICAYCYILALLLQVRSEGSSSGSGPSEPDVGELRLQGGRSEREGRLEIYLNERWGTICKELWGVEQTKVVCRQLGFYEDGQMVLTTSEGSIRANSTVPVHLENVFCRGDEPMLINCSYNTGSSCSHSKDVSITCPGNCTYGDVRLENGSRGGGDGRVEVCQGGQWGTVCDNEWDSSEATVVCKQLGYEGNRPIGVGAAYFGQGRDPILMDKVSCTRVEGNLTQCLHESPMENSCQHSEDAGVFCRHGPENCTNNDIRLVGGFSNGYGLVQVCYNGVWGAICDDAEVTEGYNSDMWHIEIHNVAEVVCRQLGFSKENTSPVIVRGYISGEVNVPLLLQYSTLKCNGQESDLSECPGHTMGEHTCSEPTGIVVACPGNCTLGELRLSGGGNSQEGIVEICVLGHWVTVCNEKWSNREAEVVCRHLGYLTPNSISVAVDGYHFGQPLSVPLYHATCSSNEERLTDCHIEIEQCSNIETAGVICDVDCDDQSTQMLLEDNEIDSVCQMHNVPSSTTSSRSAELLVGTVTALACMLLVIVLLVVLVTVLFFKLRTRSSRHGLTSTKSTNSLENSNRSTSSLPSNLFESQNSHKESKTRGKPAFHNEVALVELKDPEASLPHLYETLRGGDKLWLSSPRGSDLGVLHEERGGAAACSKDPMTAAAKPTMESATVMNSVGKSHAYAILEPEEGVRCAFTGSQSADSIPSILAAPSINSIDCGDDITGGGGGGGGGGDTTPSSCTDAVVNFDTSVPPLPPKLDISSQQLLTSSSSSRASKKPKREIFTRKFTSSVDTPHYDSLEPKRNKYHSTTKTSNFSIEDRFTLSLKPMVTSSTKREHSKPPLQRFFSEQQ